MNRRTTDATDESVVIVRELDHPVDLVWRMWTEPDHFAAWYGPAGASVPVAELDVTPGGRRRVCLEMTGPDGPMQMWFVGEFVEIDPPARLVYTESMGDADGNALGPDRLPPGHPASTEVRVKLEARGAGTVLTVTHVGVPADSAGATGWNMALDSLALYLSAL